MKHEQDLLATLQERTAIFGGTFNPIHVGHIRLATAIAQLLRLAKVVCMPCAIAPHKPNTGILPFALRYGLVQKAVEGLEHLCASDLEAQLPSGASYTWNTLEAWHERYATRPLFLLGLEDFSLLNTWKSGLDLASLADFIIVPRGEHDYTAFVQTVHDFWGSQAQPLEGEHGLWQAILPHGMAVFVPLPYLDISATHLRTLYLQGKAVDTLLPHGCAPLLEAHRAEITPIWKAIQR